MNTILRLSGRLAGYSIAALLLLGANLQAQPLQPVDRIAAVVSPPVCSPHRLIPFGTRRRAARRCREAR